MPLLMRANEWPSWLNRAGERERDGLTAEEASLSVLKHTTLLVCIMSPILSELMKLPGMVGNDSYDGHWRTLLCFLF